MFTLRSNINKTINMNYMYSTFVFKTTLGFFLVLILPLCLFSQGAIVGYADGNKHVHANNITSFPSNAQLDKLTHVFVVGLGINTPECTINGSDLPGNWNGNTNLLTINKPNTLKAT